MNWFFKLITELHVFLYRISGGKLFGRISGLDVLLLTTTGRKTGKVRTTPLLYVRNGEQLALIASYGGSDHHPGWWINLRGREGQVQVGPQRMRVTAEVANAEEKARLWPQFTAKYPGYDGYQKKTSRQIPLVLLTPVGVG
jgi:F420H(2)-dependent quinone reductase